MTRPGECTLVKYIGICVEGSITPPYQRLGRSLHKVRPPHPQQPPPPCRRLARRGTPGAARSRRKSRREAGCGDLIEFSQAPQCKPRRGGRGAPQTFASANGPPGPPLPRPGGQGGPIQQVVPPKKSRSKPHQVPISTPGTVRSNVTKTNVGQFRRGSLLPRGRFTTIVGGLPCTYVAALCCSSSCSS